MPEEEIVLNGNTYRLVKEPGGEHQKKPEFHVCVGTPEHAKQCLEAAGLIVDAMYWGNSEEGHEYWSTVSRNLSRYSKPIKP